MGRSVRAFAPGTARQVSCAASCMEDGRPVDEHLNRNFAVESAGVRSRSRSRSGARSGSRSRSRNSNTTTPKFWQGSGVGVGVMATSPESWQRARNRSLSRSGARGRSRSQSRRYHDSATLRSGLSFPGYLLFFHKTFLENGPMRKKNTHDVSEGCPLVMPQPEQKS